MESVWTDTKPVSFDLTTQGFQVSSSHSTNWCPLTPKVENRLGASSYLFSFGGRGNRRLDDLTTGPYSVGLLRDLRPAAESIS